MAASYHLRELPAGLYQIYPDSPDLVKRIYRVLHNEGFDCLLFPFNIADYLVSGSIHRETAFDLENQGLTGIDLVEKVDRILADSPFRNRTSQMPNTLSGGEQQLLAITVALQQPHGFLLGQHCFDFLSAKNLDLVEKHLVAHGKRMLEITYRTGDMNRGQTSWRLSGKQLIRITDGIPEPARATGQTLPVSWRLDLDGIEKHFDGSDFVLRIPDLTINQVSCLGIYGENGSGKTTLADCLTGITPHNGKIHVQIPGISPPRLGYLVQHMGTHTHGLSVGEILQKFTLQGRLSAHDGHHLGALIGTADSYRAIADQDARLGFRMVIVAALIAGDYDLVILDEPTYGFPTWAVAEFLSWTMEHLQAKPLAIISHDHNFLSLFCDRIIELENGVVHASRV